jgi:aminotransferase
MVENARDAILGGGRSGGELSIGGIASYQPFDGLMELKVVIHLSLSSCVIISFFI